LKKFGSEKVSGHEKPEIEICTSPDLILEPVIVSRGESESVLIEKSINSVRVSIRIKQVDDVERLLCGKFSRFLMQRADQMGILRRKAIPGYNISLLITNQHVETMYKHKIIDFIIRILEDIDREINQTKIEINSRARMVMEQFLKELVR
jgi:actin related protein 2/3 complex, subunit 4